MIMIELHYMLQQILLSIILMHYLKPLDNIKRNVIITIDTHKINQFVINMITN